MLALLAAAILDSQVVLQRYELEISQIKAPAASIFSYTVSQEGSVAIEQRHRIYRSGVKVRDETIAVDGETLKPKVVKITQRDDKYFITNIAPRTANYTLLFLRPIRDGAHVDYEYEATALRASAFVVTKVLIDGETFLPKSISFRTAAGTASGTGVIQYVRSSAYWVPIAATVEATVNGKAARERIAWSDYRFPPSLPPSTFVAPKPLPTASLPPI
jgi:hypothetical protein